MGCFLLSVHMDCYVPSCAVAGAFLINTRAGFVAMAMTQGLLLLLLALSRMSGRDQITGIQRQPTNKLSLKSTLIKTLSRRTCPSADRGLGRRRPLEEAYQNGLVEGRGG